VGGGVHNRVVLMTGEKGDVFEIGMWENAGDEWAPAGGERI